MESEKLQLGENSLSLLRPAAAVGRGKSPPLLSAFEILFLVLWWSAKAPLFNRRCFSQKQKVHLTWNFATLPFSLSFSDLFFKKKSRLSKCVILFLLPNPPPRGRLIERNFDEFHKIMWEHFFFPFFVC